MSPRGLGTRLDDLRNGLGPFAPVPGSDPAQLAARMYAELRSVDDVVALHPSAAAEHQLGMAWLNYCGWFARGEDRGACLKWAVLHLQRAVTSGEYVPAKADLARVLIEETPVRDLDMALRLAAELTAAGRLPEWLSSSVEKAKRWAGRISVPRDSDFSGLGATPAALRDERTKLRKLLVEALKQPDRSGSVVLAARLYNLGLLAACLYGDFDGSSGVSGAAYDAAAKQLRKVGASFNFDYMGRIADASFLTATDYGRIEKALGSVSHTTTVDEIRSLARRASA